MVRVDTDPAAAKVTFTDRVGFQISLKKRVDDYFRRAGRRKTGDWRMFLKTAIIFAWVLASYVMLVFFSTSAVTAAVAAFALVQGLALVGFNIMHDGAHGSYSRHRMINWLAGSTLDLIGGSQMLWRQKHNILHHTYTNIDSLDDDLQTSGLLRLSPDQKWKPWHRVQHLYAFAVYSLLTLSWVLYSDFQKFFSGRIGSYKLRRPRMSERLVFFLAKAFYFGWAIVLPLFFHPVSHVLIVFVSVHLVLGFTLSIVFQLAHTVAGNSFPRPDACTGDIHSEWAVHEVETTADFARKNILATWYLGGLNFQIEHHLLSRICHIHYPAISEIVEKTCREFRISYVSYPTVRSAVAAHYRFLRTLGARPAVQPG